MKQIKNRLQFSSMLVFVEWLGNSRNCGDSVGIDCSSFYFWLWIHNKNVFIPLFVFQELVYISKMKHRINNPEVDGYWRTLRCGPSMQALLILLHSETIFVVFQLCIYRRSYAIKKIFRSFCACFYVFASDLRTAWWTQWFIKPVGLNLQRFS